MLRKDFLFSVLRSSPIFSALTMFSVATSWAVPEKLSPAWKSPNWGFKKIPIVKSSHPLTKSLLFDQSFDKVSYRPAPKVYVSMPIARPESGEPLELHAKIEKITQEVVSMSPYFVERALPSTQPEIIRSNRLASNSEVFALSAIENALAARKQEKLLADVPVKVVASAPSPLITKSQETSAKAAPASHGFEVPLADKTTARLLVIDEESILNKSPRVIAGAKISWTGFRSGLVTESDAKGMARPPYPNVSSMRFVVEAEGYLPAMGYAVRGVVTPVVLVPEKRLAPILQSLNLVPEAGKTLVIGKVLNSKMQPVRGVSLDASVQEGGRVFYSMGSFGVFHPGAKESGAQGDFVISGLRKGLQYIMPTQNLNPTGWGESLAAKNSDENETKEWPAFVGDFSSLPPIVSLVIQQGSRADLKTQIVDSMSMEKPASGIHLSVGGQRGLFIPDDSGFVRLNEVFLRPSVDLIEVHSPGYLKSWVTPAASKEVFPDPIQMFSREQLKSVFSGVDGDVDLSKGVILAQLRPEKFHRPIVAEIFSYNGRRSRQAQIFYFDEKGLNSQLNATVPLVGGVAVTNLENGEWHLLLMDAATRIPVSGQVLRVQKNVVTQAQF